jgi:hypothetical protein
MTCKTTKGISLSKLFHREKARLAWIGKLHGNCRKLLDRLGDIVALDPVSLKAESADKSTITLRYDGLSEHLARIEKVLNTRFDKGIAQVKFSRITITVKLLKYAEAVKVAA